MKRHKNKHKDMTEKSCTDILQNRKVDYLFISILFLIISFVNLPLANTELMSPDASGYLDMGRNFFSGKGAVISYNLNQYWSERYYPFLPYMPPIFPIIAGIIWSLFLNLKAVISFNILLFSINCVLLYKILRLMVDCLSCFLITMFMGFSKTLIYTAIFPLTEQLHLFFLLLAIFIYLRWEKKVSFLVGIILAISCLTRTASFYNVFAFGLALIILKGFSKQSLKKYIKIAFGFLIVFLSYEAFCYFRYGAFYPQYLVAAKTYRSAEIFAGAFYKEGLPVLNMPSVKIGMDVSMTNIRSHLATFIKVFGNIKFALILVPLYVIYDLFKRKSPLLIIFFFQGVCVILGYTLGHTWTSLLETEIERFSLIPFITLGSIGFLSLKGIINRFFSETVEKRFPIVFLITISFFFYFQIKNYLPFRNGMRNLYPQKYKAYIENRNEMYEWIKTNTAEDSLIASNYLIDSFLFERPFVSLPPVKALIVKNLKDFLRIYRPEYILTDVIKVINFLKSIGFTEKKKSGPLVLLGRN